MKRKITLKDIAEQVGVHPATVSKALHNHPKIPEKTRIKIRRAAEELGYVPDPLLSSLSQYRRRDGHKETVGKGTLAFVTSWPQELDPKYRWGERFFFPSAKANAEKAGYRLEYYNLAEKNLSGKRLGDILYARGVSGIMLSESPALHRLSGIDWDRFCLVGIGFGLEYPVLHTVVTHPYDSLWTAISRLHGMGYRRHGLILCGWQDERTRYQWSAGYVSATRQLGLEELPMYSSDSDETQAFLRWVRAHAPDVLLDYSDLRLNAFREALKKEGLDLPCCRLNLSRPSEGPGIYQNLEGLGKKAVDILVAKIHRHERGEDPVRIQTRIYGRWVEGDG